MKIIYKILALYTIAIAGFAIYITYPEWTKDEVIFGLIAFLPIIVFAAWSLFKKDGSKRT